MPPISSTHICRWNYCRHDFPTKIALREHLTEAHTKRERTCSASTKHIERRLDGKMYARDKGIESLLGPQLLPESFTPGYLPSAPSSSSSAPPPTSSQSNPLTRPSAQSQSQSLSQTQSSSSPRTLPPPLTQNPRHRPFPLSASLDAGAASQSGSGTSESAPSSSLPSGQTRQHDHNTPSSSASGSGAGSQVTQTSSRKRMDDSTSTASLPESHPCETFEDGRHGHAAASEVAVPTPTGGPSTPNAVSSVLTAPLLTIAEQARALGFGVDPTGNSSRPTGGKFRPFGFGSAVEMPLAHTEVGRAEGSAHNGGGRGEGQAVPLPVPVSPIFGGFARAGPSGILSSAVSQPGDGGHKRPRDGTHPQTGDGTVAEGAVPTEDEARKAVRFGFGNSPAGAKRS